MTLKVRQGAVVAWLKMSHDDKEQCHCLHQLSTSLEDYCATRKRRLRHPTSIHDRNSRGNDDTNDESSPTTHNAVSFTILQSTLKQPPADKTHLLLPRS